MSASDDRALIRTALDDTLVVEAAAWCRQDHRARRADRPADPIRPRCDHEIVAVTFSEKAAGELKLRLREELEQARVHPKRKRRDPRG